MIISDTVKELLQNSKEQCAATIEALLKIANNVINHPNEEKFRIVSLNSRATENVLLSAVGALETLFLMGFEEEGDKLILPQHASLNAVTSYRDQLEQLRKENIPQKHLDNKRVKKQVIINLGSENEVKQELERQFEQILIHETMSLHEAAINAMPHQGLCRKAKQAEESMKTDKKLQKESPNLDFQDCLLIELLAWFKNEFFTWFDVGCCQLCSSPMKFSGHVLPNDDEKAFGGHRVENYECESCHCTMRFPRYFHPGKLLETRKGRCMEWASCFTLMCRALGHDTRYIWDKTDHVWVEVFSISQNRWIHADPCENKLDSPLMYEVGWKKKLSYIFAFSKDEIVDCVWKYSANHKAVCTRRTRCREDWLAATICSLNQERQKHFSEAKRNFLNIRLVKEITEFFTEPKLSKEGEGEGRLSGSLSWRLARGETSSGSGKDSSYEPFIFIPTMEELRNKEIIVKYSPSRDLYIRDTSNGEQISGWKSRVFIAENVIRKVERDWKMVYLSRTEGSVEGKVSWKFNWTSMSLQIQSILVVFQHQTFEDGVVDWQICSGDLCFTGTKCGVIELFQKDFSEDCSYVEISATLGKGKGDVAWQHAQLFRQKEHDQEFPFLVKIKFA